MTGIRHVTPLTKTVDVNHSKPDDRFVPGWGLGPAGEDDLRENANRVAQGRKKTPIGAGTLKRKG
jgi:hypothetical protein